MRDIIFSKLQQFLTKDENVFVLTGDLGYGFFNRMIQMFHGRVINCGISQQNMMSVAAGIAKQGNKVYVYSIGNFNTLRCLQQIRNDIVYHNLDVNIISSGAGLIYGQLGMSHYATQDIAVIKPMVGIDIYCPSDNTQVESVMEFTYKYNSPSYTRVSNGLITENKSAITYGKFREFYVAGNDTAIFIIGDILSLVLDIVDVDIFTIPIVMPFDCDFFKSNNYKNIIVVQQHSVIGGVGSSFESQLVSNAYNGTFKKIGISGRFPSGVGDRNYMLDYYRITKENILESV